MCLFIFNNIHSYKNIKWGDNLGILNHNDIGTITLKLILITLYYIKRYY